MKGLVNANGNWCTDEEEIENFLANYFINIFTSSNPSELNFQDVLKCIDPIVYDECNTTLLKPYTKDEIMQHYCKCIL